MNQDEYFSVHYDLKINVYPLEVGVTLPDHQTFVKEIPPLFRVASECSEQEEQAERLVKGISQDENAAIVQYLFAQNSKINLLLSYVLSQQDDAKHRFYTTSFGASKLNYIATQPLAVNQYVQTTLFLDYPPAAIYSYAQVSRCELLANNQFEVELRYVRLQEEDKDLLIRAALHQQQKLLRQRAQQRSNTIKE
ncbi:TPA: PilZ domain-containing protein [Photobacterium damselae]